MNNHSHVWTNALSLHCQLSISFPKSVHTSGRLKQTQSDPLHICGKGQNQNFCRRSLKSILHLKLSRYSPWTLSWGNIFKRPQSRFLNVNFQMHTSRRIKSCRIPFHSACCKRWWETICIFRHLIPILKSISKFNCRSSCPNHQDSKLTTSEYPDIISYRLSEIQAPKSVVWVSVTLRMICRILKNRHYHFSLATGKTMS